MIDQKLLQSVGNLAARDVETRYPQLNIRFLANDPAIRITAIGRHRPHRDQADF